MQLSQPEVKNSPVKKRGLKSNFIYNFIGQILTLIIPLITTPYLARVLHEVGNGQYSYASSIITYFILFANMGFDVYGQRQIARYQDDKYNKSRVFWELFVVKSVTTIAALAVLYAITFTVGFGENYNYLILILSIQVIAVPFDIQFLFRGDEDFRAIAIRTILMKVAALVCIFVFVKDEGDLWVYALLISVSTIAANIIMWPAIIKRISFIKPRELQLLRHIKPAFLIFLPTLAVTIYSVFDKTMIGLLAANPDYENGCYEQAYKLNSVALLLVTVISSVMISRNAHDYQTGDKDSLERHLYFACNYVWMIGVPLIVGFAVLSQNLSSWFLGDGYEEVPLLMQVMSVRFIASGFGVVFGDQLFIAIGKEKYPTIATLCAAGVNILLNYFLIPVLGATGAAIATAVCEVMVTAVLAFFAWRHKFLSLKKVLFSSWKYILSAGVMFVPIYFLQMYLGYSIWTFILITAVGAATYFVTLLLLRDKFFIFLAKNVLGSVKNKLKGRGAQAEGAAQEGEHSDRSGEDNKGDNNNV